MLQLLDLSYASLIPGTVGGERAPGSLGGPLPPSWGIAGGFNSLQTLNLTKNFLSGELPSPWGGQLNLSTLDISDNVGIYGVPSAEKLTCM